MAGRQGHEEGGKGEVLFGVDGPLRAWIHAGEEGWGGGGDGGDGEGVSGDGDGGGGGR